MSFWTEQDVLEYAKIKGIQLASVYGDIVQDDKCKLKCSGLQRTGCVYCLFGIHLDSKKGELNRIQQLKETHPKLYEYCVNGGEMVDGKWKPNKKGLGIGYVLDWLGIPY
jgi:hypothetical protein